MMHDSMQYDLIQGQDQLPQAVQSWKSGHFQKLSPIYKESWQLITDY